MKCPDCNSEDIEIKKTEQFDTLVKRYRRCKQYGCKFWTGEEIIDPSIRYVYFISSANNMIKIGITNSPNRRFEDLQYMSPVPLIFIGCMRGTFQDESNLHKKFAKYRKHGEWFEFSQEIKDFLYEVSKM